MRCAAWMISELRWPASDIRRRSDAAARTCTSYVVSGDAPVSAAASPSRTTHASSRGVSWSSFTISWRRRAVERQCTRRRLSPDLVLADAVQVVAGGAVQHRAAAVAAGRAAVGEEALEVVDARIDEHLVGAVELDARVREAERIGDQELGAVHAIAPARRVHDLVAAAQDPAAAHQLGLDDMRAAEPVEQDRAARQRAARVGPHLEPDVDALALGQLQVAGAAAQEHRPVERLHPAERGERCEREPDRHREHDRRPEPPRHQVQPGGEQEQSAAPGRHTGMAVRSSASRIESDASMPAVRASGARITRCESTSSATAFTSVGET